MSKANVRKNVFLNDKISIENPSLDLKMTHICITIKDTITSF